MDNIVKSCKNGESEAFEQLFIIYQPRLKYYLRRLDGQGSSADDILQEVWIKVLRKIKKLKEVKAFNVWLYRIARNQVYSKYRQKELAVPLPEESQLTATNHEPVFDAEQAMDLHKAMEKLKPHHREVLTLSFIEDMSYAEISDVLGCNIGTVRSRLYYAKQSLREEMERQNGK